MESYSVEAILTATDRNFSRAMRNASQAAQKADSAIGKASGGTSKFSTEADKASRSSRTMNVSAMGILKAVGAYKVASAAVGLVKNSVGSAIQRVDTLNNSARTFENMGFGKGETSKAMEALKKSIQGLPTPLDAAVRGLQLLSASTGDIGKSQQIFEALNNGILGFGGSAEQVDNAVRQLSQSFSNGKVDAETWNSLIDAGMGPALNALAKTMNMTTGEMKEGLSKGTVSVEQFQDSLIELNKNGGGGLSSLQKIAQDSTKGISTSIANMKTAVSRGVANVVTGIDKALAQTNLKSISNVINQVGSSIEAGLNKFVEKIPGIINFITRLVEVIKTLAPVIVSAAAGFAAFSVVISIQSKINAVTKAFKAWKAATEGVTLAQKLLNAAMAMNWVGIIIAAIAALVAGFIYLWKTNEGFRNAVTQIWQSILDFIQPIIETISNIIQTVFGALSEWWNENQNTILSIVQTVWGVIQATFEAVVMVIQLLVTTFLAQMQSAWAVWSNVVSAIVQVAWALISNIFGGTLKNILSVVTAVINQIKLVIDTVMKVIQNVIKVILSAIKGDWKGVLDGIMGIVSAFGDFITGTFDNVMGLAKDLIKNGIDTIKEIFKSLSKINLLDIGKAIIDGFVKGLKSAWEAGKKFISGIGDWIREHKGPIRVDRKLLIPAGNAIMGGLNKGLNNSFKTVQNSVLGMNDFLANAINAGGSVNIGANIRNANNSIGGTIAHEVNLNKGKQPAQINIRLGKQELKAFVEDINQVQGWEIAKNNLF